MWSALFLGVGIGLTESCGPKWKLMEWMRRRLAFRQTAKGAGLGQTVVEAMGGAGRSAGRSAAGAGRSPWGRQAPREPGHGPG